MKSLSALLPAVYTEADQNDGSLGVYVAAWDELQSEIVAAIHLLKQIGLPQKTTFVQDNATKFGNPFPFMTDVRWQNQDAIDQLVNLYGLRGTQFGMAQACSVLCKLPITVTQDLQYAWVLGESQLGEPD